MLWSRSREEGRTGEKTRIYLFSTRWCFPIGLLETPISKKIHNLVFFDVLGEVVEFYILVNRCFEAFSLGGRPQTKIRLGRRRSSKRRVFPARTEEKSEKFPFPDNWRVRDRFFGEVGLKMIPFPKIFGWMLRAVSYFQRIRFFKVSHWGIGKGTRI